jgi:hypothetical protein
MAGLPIVDLAGLVMGSGNAEVKPGFSHLWTGGALTVVVDPENQVQMGIVNEPTGRRLLQASELTGEYTIKWEPQPGMDVSTFIYDLLQHSPPQTDNTKAENDIIYVNDLLVARGWTSPSEGEEPTMHDPTTRVSYLVSATENPVVWPTKLLEQESEDVTSMEDAPNDSDEEVEVQVDDLPPQVLGEEINI